MTAAVGKADALVMAASTLDIKALVPVAAIVHPGEVAAAPVFDSDGVVAMSATAIVDTSHPAVAAMGFDALVTVASVALEIGETLLLAAPVALHALGLALTTALTLELLRLTATAVASKLLGLAITAAMTLHLGTLTATAASLGPHLMAPTTAAATLGFLAAAMLLFLAAATAAAMPATGLR